MSTNLFMLELHSNPRNVNLIESYVDRVVEKFSDINEDMYGNILISLTEAVNNAIIHGNNADESKKVWVNLEKTERRISFKITDEGAGFNFDELPDPTAPENILKLGGRGVFLMQQLSDTMDFHDNGSTVELKFSLV